MIRLIVAALRSRRSEGLVLGLLAMLAVAAGVGAPMFATAADQFAISSAVAEAAPADRSVTLSAQINESTLDQAVGRLKDSLVGEIPPRSLTVITGAWTSGLTLPPRADQGDQPLTQVNAPLAARDGFCDHLKLQGACATKAGEVVISDETAKFWQLKTGDKLAFGEGRVTVVGVYSSVDTTLDPYWAGRIELTPRPLRPGNPVLTPLSTLMDLKIQAALANVDLVAGNGSLTPTTLPEVRSSLRHASLELATRYTLTWGLGRLVDRIEDTRDELVTGIPISGLQLVLLCWFVLILVVTYGAAGRRTEIALGTLRGAPRRHRVLLALGPTACVLLAAAPFGIALGWLMVRALTWVTFTGPGAGALSLTPLAWASAGLTLLAVLVSAALAERRAHAMSLLDAMREVPARRGGRSALAVESVVFALAVASVIQASASDSGADPAATALGLLAPLLVSLVLGLLFARLIRPAAAAFGAARLHRGHLASGLTALQLARRPGADRLVTLIVVTMSLAGFAVANYDVAAHQAQEKAAIDLGASRVVTVYAKSRNTVLAATRKIDPQGRFAMAVARRDLGSTNLLAVDSSRLAAVASWPDQDGLPSAAEVAKLLHPKANDPVMITGSELVLTFEADPEGGSFGIATTLKLVGPNGDPVSVEFLTPVDEGVHVVKVPVPACATAPGCRLGWFSFLRNPFSVHLKKIAQTGPDRTVLEGAAIRSDERWRAEIGTEPENTLTVGDDWVTMLYIPSNPLFVSRDIRLAVADTPVPLPVFAMDEPKLAQTRELRSYQIFGERPIDILGVAPVLPGLGRNGMLADLEYADRVSDSMDGDSTMQVWLNSDAPSDVDEKLRELGVVPVSSETRAQRVEAYRAKGANLGMWLHLGAGAIGVLLAALALSTVAAIDRRRRAVEWEALRVQGLPRKTVRRALGGYGVVVAVGIPAGVLTWLFAWWLGPPRPGPDGLTVAYGLAAAAALLALAAWLAKRRLARTIDIDESTAGGVA